MAALEIYLSLLMRMRRVTNLVGATTREEAFILCADSFFLASFLEKLALPPDAEIWDPGAGAGLPGIPLRMVRRQGRYTMIESREKRVLFIKTALARLDLPRTFVAHERAEHFFARATAEGRHADCIVSRAFMPWQKLLDFTCDALAPDGILCILANAPPPLILPAGWNLVGEEKYTVGNAQRWFWALRRGFLGEIAFRSGPA